MCGSKPIGSNYGVTPHRSFGPLICPACVRTNLAHTHQNSFALRQQYSALENQMGEERRARESKLQERLAKKREEKQAELAKAALSAAVSKHKMLPLGCRHAPKPHMLIKRNKLTPKGSSVHSQSVPPTREAMLNNKSSLVAPSTHWRSDEQHLAPKDFGTAVIVQRQALSQRGCVRAG